MRAWSPPQLQLLLLLLLLVPLVMTVPVMVAGYVQGKRALHTV